MLRRVDGISDTLAREVGEEQRHIWLALVAIFVVPQQKITGAQHLQRFAVNRDIGSIPGAKRFGEVIYRKPGWINLTLRMSLEEDGGHSNQNRDDCEARSGTGHCCESFVNHLDRRMGWIPYNINRDRMKTKMSQ